MKKIIKLTENDLHKIVKNSVKRVINEDRNNARKQMMDLLIFLERNGFDEKTLFDALVDELPYEVLLKAFTNIAKDEGLL